MCVKISLTAGVDLVIIDVKPAYCNAAITAVAREVEDAVSVALIVTVVEKSPLAIYMMGRGCSTENVPLASMYLLKHGCALIALMVVGNAILNASSVS